MPLQHGGRGRGNPNAQPDLPTTAGGPIAAAARSRGAPPLLPWRCAAAGGGKGVGRLARPRGAGRREGPLEACRPWPRLRRVRTVTFPQHARRRRRPPPGPCSNHRPGVRVIGSYAGARRERRPAWGGVGRCGAGSWALGRAPAGPRQNGRAARQRRRPRSPPAPAPGRDIPSSERVHRVTKATVIASLGPCQRTPQQRPPPGRARRTQVRARGTAGDPAAARAAEGRLRAPVTRPFCAPSPRPPGPPSPP